MPINKKILGFLFFLGFINFVYGQQDNSRTKCLDAANAYKNSVFILLDPGHGGPSNNGRTCTSGDSGALDKPNYASYHEACMTTDLALRLRDVLNQICLDVGMTRDTNRIQKLTEKSKEIRKQIVNKRNEKGVNFKPYFISIHFNGGPPAACGNYGLYAYSNRSNENVQTCVSGVTPYFLDRSLESVY